jgi:hypothetical protein
LKANCSRANARPAAIGASNLRGRRIEIPVSRKIGCDLAALENVSRVSFDVELAVAVDVVQVGDDGTFGLAAAGDLHHDLGHPTNGAGDVLDLGRR